MYICRKVYIQLTLLSCAVLFTSGCVNKRRSKVEKIVSNALLSGTYPLAVKQTASLLQCTHKCIVNIECQSVNHDRIGGICELLSVENKNNVAVVEKKYGWDHYAVMTQELSSVLCKSLPGYINKFAPSVYISLAKGNRTHGFYDVGSDIKGNTAYILPEGDTIEETDELNALKRMSQKKFEIGYFRKSALSNPVSDKCTLMFWFKSRSRVVPVEKDCFLMKIGGVVDRGVSVHLNTDGKILVRIRNLYEENSIEMNVPPATLQHWTHLAITWDFYRGNKYKVILFINGEVVEIGSHFPTSDKTMPNTNEKLHITCTSIYFSNLAIWWDVVSNNDVIDIYKQSKCCA